MNLLEALSILHGVAGQSPQMASRHGRAALKVVARKIQSLQRKKAWRDCSAGSMPPHATDPQHPLNKGFKFDPPVAPDSGFPNVIPMWAPRANTQTPND